MTTRSALRLALDTALPHCAVAVLEGDVVLAEATEAMARGQAERLMLLVEAVLAEAGVGVRDLTAVAVGVGPGNFTGIRIAVAAARGMALGLGIPAVGVSLFEVMRDPRALGAHASELVSLPAPHGDAYVQRFHHGRAQGPAAQIDPANPPALLATSAILRVRGYRADEIAPLLGAEGSEGSLEDVARRIGAVAHWRLSEGGDATERPAPLYVRPPDAAPPSVLPPVLLP